MSVSSQVSVHEDVETIYVKEEEYSSSEDPPWDEWSSLLLLLNAPEDNPKKLLAAEGLYDPGSGEICAKYIAQSDSSILRHPYFKYPAVEDPGIEDALYEPEPIITYEDDGQDLYLALCEEMGICPCMLFHRQMLDEHINLRYYGISPEGFRPMMLSLANNNYVKSIDFTDNNMSNDGCYHLGQLLLTNENIYSVNLHGCKIRAAGAFILFKNLQRSRTLKILDLSHNDLGDTGLENLANSIAVASSLSELNLTYNNITSKGLLSLCEAFETNNILTHLDLSWNTILVPKAILELCKILSQNSNLEYLSLAWNSLSPRFASAIAPIFFAPKLKHLDLSNNSLCDSAIVVFGTNLSEAKKLETLDLSSNPLSLVDGQKICSYMRFRKVKLKNLLLNNVLVSQQFVDLKDRILKMKFRKDSVITHGEVRPKFVPKLLDMRELSLRRLVLLCSKPKKKAVNIPILLLKLGKRFNYNPIVCKELMRAMKEEGAFQINEDLIEEMINAFPGPKKGKGRSLNWELLMDYVKRKWPDVKLPVTPPPEPEPEPEPVPVKGKGGKEKEKPKPGKDKPKKK